jgi:hypothetical protein
MIIVGRHSLVPRIRGPATIITANTIQNGMTTSERGIVDEMRPVRDTRVGMAGEVCVGAGSCCTRVVECTA